MAADLLYVEMSIKSGDSHWITGTRTREQVLRTGEEENCPSPCMHSALINVQCVF